MADVSQEKVRELWYATPDSSWESLKQGLDQIYNYRKIDLGEYEDMKWAIQRLYELDTDFPTSYLELHQRMDFYM